MFYDPESDFAIYPGDGLALMRPPHELRRAEEMQNLTSVGTMGVVYGAGGWWNCKLSNDEPGWPNWANTWATWYDSIDFEGSRYVGLLSRDLEGLDLADAVTKAIANYAFRLCRKTGARWKVLWTGEDAGPTPA